MSEGRKNSATLTPRPAHPEWLARLADYWTLTKPEVNFLVLVSTLVGFYLAAHGAINGWLLFHTLAGTLLVASGTGTLNQDLERRTDAFMRRTANRPLPAGRLSHRAAFWFGILLAIAGGAELWIAANPLTSALALATLATYLIFYTPLKRRTPLCTLVGAFPGAMPPLIGWAAASGTIVSGEAWILYAVLFFWQFPHFMAIAWMYREDYAGAGYCVLPTGTKHMFVAWQTLAPSLALFFCSLAAVAANDGRGLHYFSAALLASGVLYYAFRQVLLQSGSAARQLLRATIFYLPLEFLILVLAKH
jgi:heme o synthase